jgi:hypothetical protein
MSRPFSWKRSRAIVTLPNRRLDLQDRVVGGNVRLDESRSFELEVSFDLLSEVLRGSPQRPMG